MFNIQENICNHIQCWVLHYKIDNYALEQVQWEAAEMDSELKHKMSENLWKLNSTFQTEYVRREGWGWKSWYELLQSPAIC